MGISDEHNPCSGYTRSVLFSQSFALHQLQPSEDSAKVSRHLLNFMGPKRALYRAQFSRRLLGTELADSLSIGSSKGPYMARTLTHLWVLRIYAWASSLPVISWLVSWAHGALITRILKHISPTSHAVSNSPHDEGFARVHSLHADSELVPVLESRELRWTTRASNKGSLVAEKQQSPHGGEGLEGGEGCPMRGLADTQPVAAR